MFEGAIAGMLRGLVRRYCVASTRLQEGWRSEARLVNRRRRLSARPCARRHHRRIYGGQCRCRRAYRPAIGSVEVCTPQASHDDGKLLKGPNVGRRDTPISVLLLAGYLIIVVQCE